MGYAFFTNLPASTQFPAHSVDGGRAVSASVGMGRLIALLVMAATEFVAIAVSAYFAAVVLSPVDPAVLARPGQVPLIPKGVL
jgi:hypothetical protein